MLVLILCFTEAKNSCSNQFVILDDCQLCQGHNLTYECTVVGGGATIWKGTAFDCPLADDEVIIFHHMNYTSQRPQTCNDGAIIGRAISVENDVYTSQLNIQVDDTENLMNTTVVCAHDNGTHTMEIGSAMLNTAQFSPPSDIQLVEANNTHLRFSWSPDRSLCCPSVQHHIMASNCGECPSTTTTNTVTCSGNYTQLISDHPCSLAVQTVVRGELVGYISIAVTIPMPETGIGPTDYEGEISSSYSESDDVTSSSPVIVITLGSIIGAMFIIIVSITLISITISTTLLKSKQTLRLELDHLHARLKEQPVIYEEIGQLQDSLKSSSPAIDVGENTAYVSAISMNACAKVST